MTPGLAAAGKANLHHKTKGKRHALEDVVEGGDDHRNGIGGSKRSTQQERFDLFDRLLER